MLISRGGVVITCHNSNENYGAIGIFTPFNELNSVLKKVLRHKKFYSIMPIVYTRTSYRLTDKMHSDYPKALSMLSKGHAYDMASNIFQRLPFIFYDEKPQDGSNYVQIIGRENNKRVFKYIKRDYINDVINFEKYKVFIAGANGSPAKLKANPFPLGDGFAFIVWFKIS